MKKSAKTFFILMATMGFGVFAYSAYLLLKVEGFGRIASHWVFLAVAIGVFAASAYYLFVFIAVTYGYGVLLSGHNTGAIELRSSSGSTRKIQPLISWSIGYESIIGGVQRFKIGISRSGRPFAYELGNVASVA